MTCSTGGFKLYYVILGRMVLQGDIKQLDLSLCWQLRRESAGASPDDVRQDTNFAALLKADGNDMGDLRNPIRKPFWDFVIVKNGKEGD